MNKTKGSWYVCDSHVYANDSESGRLLEKTRTPTAKWNIFSISTKLFAGYLMCVAGRDSSCLERKSSLCLSWCFCFSGRSTISGFSISSSISPTSEKINMSITYICSSCMLILIGWFRHPEEITIKIDIIYRHHNSFQYKSSMCF